MSDDIPLHGYKEDFDGRFDDLDRLMDDENQDDEEDQIREDEIRIA